MALSGCGGGAVSSNDGGGSPSPVPSSSYSLVVEVEGAGSVTSTPGGIACSDAGGTCDAVYQNGIPVTLVAAPADEYVFDGWVSSDDGCSNGATCTASASGTAITVASTSTSSATRRVLRAVFSRRGYVLSVATVGSGSVTSAPAGIACGSDCSERYLSGTSVTLSAAPASGYTFTGWSGSGIGCAGTGSCTVAMTAARAVTATFGPVAAPTYALQVTVSGSGTVSSAPAGIACGADCSESYASGTSVALAATPAGGYTFSGWNGGGCTGTGGCVVSMTAARTVSATFVPTTYLLSVAVSGSGSVSSSPAGISCGADCTQTYNSGTSVTLTATPASGYTFAGWSGGGCSGTGSCTVAMTAARTATAAFVPATYLLSITRSGSGTVTSAPAGIVCGADCSESYASGTSVTLTAAAASGYVFSGWSGGGCSGAGACTVTMTAARSVTATFAATYALTVARSGAGTVTSAPAGISCGTTCSANYASGTSLTLTATPAAGHVFSGWGGACAGVSTCTVSMTAARNVTATFSANTAVGLYQVAWDAVPDARVTAYRLYYSTAPLTNGGAQTVNVGNVTAYTFDPSAAGLSIGTTVYFAVTALADGLESPLSESVSVVLE